MNHCQTDLFRDLEEMEIAPGQMFCVGKDLPSPNRDALIHLLQMNLDVITWSLVDLPCIDPNIIIHKLNVLPGSKLVRKKMRGMALV